MTSWQELMIKDYAYASNLKPTSYKKDKHWHDMVPTRCLFRYSQYWHLGGFGTFTRESVLNKIVHTLTLFTCSSWTRSPCSASSEASWGERASIMTHWFSWGTYNVFPMKKMTGRQEVISINKSHSCVIQQYMRNGVLYDIIISLLTLKYWL